jgi:hypothetical protein
MFVASYFNLEMNIYHQMTYGLFIGCCLYVTSFLPYGRFYNKLGGNIGLIYAYMYVFCYLFLFLFLGDFNLLLLFFFFIFGTFLITTNTALHLLLTAELL